MKHAHKLMLVTVMFAGIIPAAQAGEPAVDAKPDSRPSTTQQLNQPGQGGSDGPAKSIINTSRSIIKHPDLKVEDGKPPVEPAITGLPGGTFSSSPAVPT